MRSRFIQTFAACLATITAACPCNGGDDSKPEKSSALLLDWKHSQRISLDMEKSPPEKVFKEIERQSGVRITDSTGIELMTLKIKDVPVWQALAEASIASNTGLKMGSGLERGSRSVEFAGKNSFPSESRPRVFDRYQVLGPFLIGMCWSPKLLQKDKKAQPGVLVRVLSFRSEAGVSVGIDLAQSLALRDAKGKRYPLKPAKAPDGSQQLNQAHAVVPAGLEQQKMDLCGSFDGAVHLNPKDFVVSIDKRHVLKFDDFAGLSVRVVKAVSKTEPGVECELQWDLNLNDNDTKTFRKFADAERNETMTPADAVKAIAWMKSKRGEIRLLSIMDIEALDKDKKGVHVIYRGLDFDRLELGFAKGPQAVELRLRVAETKHVTGVFEFKNVFAKK